MIINHSKMFCGIPCCDYEISGKGDLTKELKEVLTRFSWSQALGELIGHKNVPEYLAKTVHCPDNFSQEEVNEIVEHEKAHHDAAKRLGCDSYYFVSVFEDSWGEQLRYQVETILLLGKRKLTPLEAKTFFMAPKKPSDIDYERLGKFRGIMEK